LTFRLATFRTVNKRETLNTCLLSAYSKLWGRTQRTGRRRDCREWVSPREQA